MKNDEKKIRFSIQVSESLYKKMVEQAESDRRSVSGWVRVAIEEALKDGE